MTSVIRTWGNSIIQGVDYLNTCYDSIITDEPGSQFDNFGWWDFMTNCPTCFYGSYIGKGFIQFDLTSLAPGTVITSAKLKLYAYNVNNTPTVDLHRVLKRWNEGNGTGSTINTGEIRWDSARYLEELWEVPGATGSSDVSATITDSVFFSAEDIWYEFDVTTDVEDMVNDSVNNHGWIMIANSDLVAFSSSQYTDATRPYLEITFEQSSSSASTSSSSESIKVGVVRTGSITEIQSSNSTGNVAIIVPADAEICVVSASYYQGVSGRTFTTLNWDNSGLDFTEIRSDSGNAGLGMSCMYYDVSPPTGSQTLYWGWGISLLEGANIFVSFYKNIDTASPIVTHDGEQQGALTANATLSGLAAGQLAIGVAYSYSLTSTLTWTNLTEQAEISFNTNTGGFAEEAVAGSTINASATCVGCSSYITISAVVLAEVGSISSSSLSSSSTSSSSTSVSSSSTSTRFENLTTYIKVDSNGDLTVNAPTVVFDTMQNDAVTYLYKDFGAGFFGDVKVDFEFQITNEERGARIIHCSFSNTIGTREQLSAALDGLSVETVRSPGFISNVSVWLIDESTSEFVVYQAQESSTNLLYCTLLRVGTSLTLDIYSDSSRTTLLDTLNIVAETETKRYFYTLISEGNPPPSTELGSGYSQNYELFEVSLSSSRSRSSSSFSSSSRSSSSSISSSSSRSSSLSISSSCHFPVHFDVTLGDRDVDTYNGVTEDSYGDGDPGQEDFNYGSDEHMLVGFYGDAGRNTFIKFDLDPIRNLLNYGSDIDNATLNLAVGSNFITGDGKLYIHRLRKDWNAGDKQGVTASDGQVTWRSAKHDEVLWGSPGADSSSDRTAPLDSINITSSTIGYVSFDVKDAVAYMFDSTSSEDYGFTFSFNFTGGLEFVSSESPQQYRPYLDINATVSCSSSSSSSSTSSSSSSSTSSLSSSSSSQSSSCSSSSSSYTGLIIFGEDSTATYTGVTEDTYVDSELQNYNFGQSTVLQVLREMTPGLKNTLIKFDLSALHSIIANIGYIEDATLCMKTTGSPQEGIQIGAYQIARDWDGGIGNGDPTINGEADWDFYSYTTLDPYAGRWSVAGCLSTYDDIDHIREELSQNKVDTSNKWYRWDVTESVKNQYVSEDYYGFILRYPVLNGDLVFGETEFYSSETLNPSNRPYLVVNLQLSTSSSSSSSSSST